MTRKQKRRAYSKRQSNKVPSPPPANVNEDGTLGDTIQNLLVNIQSVVNDIYDLIVSGGGGGGASVNDIWSEALPGGYAAGEAGNILGTLGDPWATALPGAYAGGTAGNILGNNLDDSISNVRADIVALNDITGQDVWDVITGAAPAGSYGILIETNLDQTLSGTEGNIRGGVQTLDTIWGRIGAPAGADIAADIAANLTAIGNLDTEVEASSLGVGGGSDAANTRLGELARWMVDNLSTAAGASTAVWSEPVPGGFGAGTAGNILGNNLDDSISNVRADIAALNDIAAADVWNIATGTGGLGSYGRLLDDNLDDSISNVIADIAALNDISAAQVNAEVDTALEDIGLDHHIVSALPAAYPSIITNDSIIDYMMNIDASQTFDRTTDSLEGIAHSLAATLASKFIAGTAYFVSTTGNDANTGLGWDEAFLTIDHAYNQCGSGDVIFIAPGTYDETANGVSGVICDTDNVGIFGTSGVFVTNTNINNNGRVFTVSADNNWISDINIQKGENTSNNSYYIYVTGNYNNIFDIQIEVENKADHIGIYFDGSLQSAVRTTVKEYSHIVATNSGIGTGIVMNNSSGIDIHKIQIDDLALGILYTNGATNCTIGPSCHIKACTIGIQWDIGVTNNVFFGHTGACNTSFVDNSTNTTNDKRASATYLSRDVSHINKHGGDIWYVNGTNGDDNYIGTSPEEPFQTINAAIAAASAGDRIHTASDTYDEAINLNLDGLELVCEKGTILNNTTPGTVVTISAPDCLISGPIIQQAGQTGIDVQAGNMCANIQNLTLYQCDVGIDINSITTLIRNIRILQSTTTGIDISSSYLIGDEIQIVGDNAAGTRGIYFSSAGANNNILKNIVTQNNPEACVELVAGANNNIISNLGSGSNDGAIVNNGTDNLFENYAEGSQIVVDQSRDQDLKDIFDAIAGLIEAEDTDQLIKQSFDSYTIGAGDIIKVFQIDALQGTIEDLYVELTGIVTAGSTDLEVTVYSTGVGGADYFSEWDTTILTAIGSNPTFSISNNTIYRWELGDLRERTRLYVQIENTGSNEIDLRVESSWKQR